jgi:membrane protein DedA with SNARE-associated domain
MSAPQLPGIFGALAPLLNSYGYLAVGGLLFLEDFGVPVPGETILIAAAVYAGAGQLNIVAVVSVGFLAAVLGDNVGFAIGHFGGRALVLRFGRYVFLTDQRLGNAEAFFTRHGGKVVTIARFVEGLRQANGIVAGLAGMPWRRFLVFNALGAAIWVGAWGHGGILRRQPPRHDLRPGQTLRAVPAQRARGPGGRAPDSAPAAPPPSR